jgi:hypothetical protein
VAKRGPQGPRWERLTACQAGGESPHALTHFERK